MKKRCAYACTLLLAAAVARGACPTGTTRVADTLTDAAGNAIAAGSTIAVYGPSVAIASGGTTVASTVTVTVGAGGTVDFCLVGGVGYAYRATYTIVHPTRVDSRGQPLVLNRYAEDWVVPLTGGSLSVKRLQDGAGKNLGVISPQRINPEGLTAGQTWVWDGTSWVAGNGGSGTGLDASSTWSAIEAGTNGTGSITGSSTWTEIEG